MNQNSMPLYLDKEKCTLCGLCVEVCPSFVFKGSRDSPPEVKNPERCIACDHCGAVCPSEAISFPGRPLSLPKIKTFDPEFLQELIQTRRSIRIYKKEPISKDLIEEVLDAGRYAPTGSNRQNVRYIVFTSPDKIAELRELVVAFYRRVFAKVKTPLGALTIRLAAGKKTFELLRSYLPLVEEVGKKLEAGEDRLFFHAPAVIMAHAEVWDSCSPFNCAAALYACALKAHALGLGTCFNGFLQGACVHDKTLREWLRIPDDHRVFAAMTLGKPALDFKRWVYRKPPQVDWR